MYVLELAMEGDYGDFYERPTEVIAVSKDEKKLKDIWNTMKIKFKGNVEFREYEGELFIDYHIYNVPEL